MKKVILIALIVLLSSCHRKYKKPINPASHPNIITTPATSLPSDEASIRLAEAATAISHSLEDLKAMEKASAPPNKRKNFFLMEPRAISGLVSIDWAGPLEPLLSRLASMTCYTFRTLGRPPSIPILVNITVRNTSINHVIRDANLQAGKKADIVVFPRSRVIELYYGPQ